MVHIPRWQMLLVLALLLVGIVFAAPNLIGRESAEALPDWFPHKQINLGLDLQGGSYLLLEADIESVVQERLENEADAMRRELRRAKIGYQGGIRVEGVQVVFDLRDPADGARARQLIRDLSADYLVEVSEAGRVAFGFNEVAFAELRTNILEQSRQVLQLRIDETGVKEPTIQRQGDRRILVQLPGVDDPERLKAIIGQTAKLTFRFVRENLTPGIDPTPPGTEVLTSRELDSAGNPIRFVVERRVMVSGENLVDARSSVDENNRPSVSFRFDTLGGQRFGRATQENVRRIFAIVLDDQVISAPQIREPILGGNGQITGRFTFQETEDLALLLRAGALPAPLTFLEERTVGPGLGADSILAGKIASVLGLIFVIVFMALSYGAFGLIADLALMANLVLLVALLSGFQATLTLPGIAGIVLTIGMAVDANVLIFERIREEIRLGRGPVTAIDVGYRRALTTIMDSNLTTLIAAVLLFFFGSGPVKGFAVTLSLGIMTSMFTAIMVTRLMVVTWLRRLRPQTLPI